MTTVVVDPVALLPFNLDHDVVYCRTPESALNEVMTRRASGQSIHRLWLRWALGTGRDEYEFDAEPIIAALVDEAKAGKPYPVGNIIVMTYSSARGFRAFDRLQPWYDVDLISPHDTALIYPPRLKPRPRPDLPPMERLRRAGVHIEPGLSDPEIRSVQDRYGFTFSPAHRQFLKAGLPVDLPVDRVPTRHGWPDWRDGDSDDLASLILHPDLRQLNEHHTAAGDHVPLLIPLHGIRYLPAGSAYARSPVFSAHERDIIYYGASISGWIGISFEGVPWPLVLLPRAYRVPFWSDIADPR